MRHYLLRHRYKFYLIVLLIILIGVPTLSHIFIEDVFLPRMRISQKLLIPNYDEIRSDLKQLIEHPIFPDFSNKKNAEKVFSRHIAYNGDGGFSPDTLQSARIKKFHKFYLGWREDENVLKALLADKDIKQVDTAWMTELNEYDHWDFTQNYEVNASLEVYNRVNTMTRFEIFSSISQPNYLEIRTLALINFFKLAGQGHALEGLRTHRQVANLIHSSGTIVGNIAASSMLRDEHRLMEYFKIKNWSPYSYYYISTYIRTSWAWIELIRASLFTGIPDDFFDLAKTQTGICGALWELSPALAIYVDFFQPQVTLESDFTGPSRAFLSKHPVLAAQCRSNLNAVALSRSPASENIFSSHTHVEADLPKIRSLINYETTIIDNWVYIPFIRRIVGGSLLTEPTANYTKLFAVQRRNRLLQNYNVIE